MSTVVKHKMKLFSEIINNYLDEKGLSQTELAYLCKMSTSSMNRILNSDSHPRKETVNKIAQALSVKIQYQNNEWTIHNEYQKVFENQDQIKEPDIKYKSGNNLIEYQISQIRKAVNDLEQTLFKNGQIDQHEITKKQ